MNKEHPARAAGPPGRPSLPPEAEAEIMERLSANMKITSEEIAAILGQRPGTVRSHLSRARDALRRYLSDEEGEG